MKASQKVKLFIILGIEFIAVAVILLLIFFSGKQSYTVQFDLNGGTLLSGELEQTVRQGGNATPPKAAKDGCYFLKWSGSYSKVTRDVVVEAVWEYETSPGIEYNIAPNGNYCTISGGFEGLQGDVYIGAYKGDLKVLGIEAGAFQNCKDITSIHLLDGILTIGDNAFAGCTSLTSIELPETVARMGANVFKDCTALTSVTLPKDLQELSNYTFSNCSALEKVVMYEGLTGIGDYAFRNCTSLKKVEVPSTVLSIGSSAFRGCTALTRVTLHEGLEKISSYAFYDCIELQELTVPSTVPFENVGTNAFFNTQLVFAVEYPTIELPIIKPFDPGVIIRPNKGDTILDGDLTIGDKELEEELAGITVKKKELESLV